MTHMDAAKLRGALGDFRGTERWHRHSPLLLTDGVRFLCENAGAYWLIDAIGSHVVSTAKLSPKHNPAQFWTLLVKDGAATLICTDGGKHGRDPVELARQEIEYTDFPLGQIDIWVMWDEIVEPKGAFVVLLPGEY